ncbi:MAG TPA: transposase [Phycisphaerae bacterium]|nr:transposase [Phycisphaerae bacterium]
MARLARVVAPGWPHHITQRGNRRQQTFFCQDDYLAYKALLAEWCRTYGVSILAYCLMPNHVHLVAVPTSVDGLRLAIGKAHLRYSRRVNFREGWRGHLWQGRFASFVMDELYLRAAVRYIERNPVRARLVERAWDWPWSSAAAHLAGRDDGLVTVEPMRAMIRDWRAYLSNPEDEQTGLSLRRHESTGRPMGDDSFIARLESALQRVLRRQKPGPKPKRDITYYREQYSLNIFT